MEKWKEFSGRILFYLIMALVVVGSIYTILYEFLGIDNNFLLFTSGYLFLANILWLIIIITIHFLFKKIKITTKS